VSDRERYRAIMRVIERDRLVRVIEREELVEVTERGGALRE